MKIGMILPENLVDIAKKAANRFEQDITVVGGTMDEGVILAKRLEEEGYDALISRGGTQILINQSGIKIPNVAVPITSVDIFQAVTEAEALGGDSNVLIAFSNMLPASDSYTKIAGRPLRIIRVKDELDVDIILRGLAEENIKVVIGGGIIANYAHFYGITPIVIKSGEESFISAIEETIRITLATRAEKKVNERIKAIIDNSHDGIICIDNEGIVNIFNKSAEDLLGIKSRIIVGKYIDDFLPELGLRDTIDSGVEETGIVKNIKDKKTYISKIPIKVNSETTDVVAIIKDIDEIYRLEGRVRQEIKYMGHYTKYTFEEIIGDSEATKELIRVGKEYAKVDSTVLIEGETGTGKEVIAQSIHNHSHRSHRPFVAINCSAIPVNLLESELFGYVSGAFTGADRRGKKGLFEVAHEGTIFLDEISGMDPMIQSRLLRVLQEKQIMRIGDSKLIPINVRVIAATNRDLYKLVQEGKFREDLYYRLNVLHIYITPIRDRKEDIYNLLNHFVKIYCDRLGKDTMNFTWDAKDYLLRYNWPGNVREIRNFAERLSVTAKKSTLGLKDIKNHMMDRNMSKESVNNQKTREDKIFSLIDMEKRKIELAIKECDGKIGEAADILEISRTTLWRKMNKYNIEVSK